MNTEYLTWYKNLEIELHGCKDSCLLLSSAVSEPTEFLEKQLRNVLKDDFATTLAIPDSWGYPPLIDAIAERYGVNADCVVPTGGVSNAIYLLCRTLFEDGSEVVVETPSYEPLRIVPDSTGYVVATFRRQFPDYVVDLDHLRSVISTNTQFVLLSNLHNPSCSLLTDDELFSIAETAKSINPNILIIVDEVYHDFVFDKQRPAALLDDCFISLNSLSKVYGLSSIHVGWIIARSDIASKLRRMFVTVEGSGSRLRDLVATAVVLNMDQYLRISVQQAQENRSILHEFLQPFIDDNIIVGAIPTHGCTYFPRITGVDDTSVLAVKLADKFGVYIVPGCFFNSPGHIRIGYGGPTGRFRDCMKKFVEAMRTFR